MLLLISWISTALFMAALWQYQRRKGEADIVDFGWTISLAFVAFLFYFNASANSWASGLTVIFASVWATRLASHIWKRVQEPGEDQRYLELRKSWGTAAQTKFFIFFQAQALLAVVLSTSFIVPITQVYESGQFQLILASAWFFVTIGGEALSDLQLRRWREKSENKGRTCRAGLWKYSRHPNYFFEWLYWFSYVILAYGASYWWLTLLSPITILFLILKVTGIPPTEERALKTRAEDYKEYQRTTSAFVPWRRRGI